MAAKEATVVTPVTMLDGRIVEFAGKRKILKESLTDESGNIFIRIDFRNGETRKYGLQPSLVSKFAAHGAEQKYGDACAGLEDIDDCVEAVDNLFSRLEKGDWNAARESNGMAGASTLLKALVEVYGKTVEQIREFLAKKTQAEKIALRNSAKIKPIVERIEAEKASKKGAGVDTEALTAELDALS